MGQQIASNAFGANMEAGLVSALAKAPDATLAVLEVDEKYLPAMLTATSARVVVLLNLSRDQMDRAAEIWMLARRWRAALAAVPGCRVIANADDPLVAWAAGEARQVTWVAAGQRWHDDSWCCPNCGSHLRRDGEERRVEPGDIAVLVNRHEEAERVQRELARSLNGYVVAPELEGGLAQYIVPPGLGAMSGPLGALALAANAATAAH